MSAPRHCSELNSIGEPCGAPPLRDQDICAAHAGIIGGPVPLTGLNDGRRRPTPNEVLRYMIEAELDVWLAPYRQAVAEAMKHYTEEGVIVTSVPDLGARMAATEKVLDRVYGRPRQMVEHTGADGGPITIADLAKLARDDEEATHGEEG